MQIQLSYWRDGRQTDRQTDRRTDVISALYSRCVLLSRHAKISVMMGLVFTYPILNCCLKKWAESHLVTQMDHALERGSTPYLPKIIEDNLIDRKGLRESIMRLFIPTMAKKKLGYFGVILEPSGTGKTTIISNICRKHPEGVIYLEICEPESFSQRLAAKMGMRLGPSNIEDVVLGYLSEHYYELPCGQLLALDFVLDKFKGAAIRYQGKKYSFCVYRWSG